MVSVTCELHIASSIMGTLDAFYMSYVTGTDIRAVPCKLWLHCYTAQLHIREVTMVQS